MNTNQQESDGATRVAYILGVPLAENVVRQWPQMGEIVRTSKLVADVEGNFPELTLEVGRRLQLDDVVVVEWTCDYGDGRLYRNVTIGELEDGQGRARHRLLGRAHRDTRMAPAADRSTRHARRRHLAGRRAPRPLLEVFHEPMREPASGADGAYPSDDTLYDRMLANLLGSWALIAEGTAGASIEGIPGGVLAVFPAGPERLFYNNAVLAQDLNGSQARDAAGAIVRALRGCARGRPLCHLGARVRASGQR